MRCNLRYRHGHSWCAVAVFAFCLAALRLVIPQPLGCAGLFCIGRTRIRLPLLRFPLRLRFLVIRVDHRNDDRNNND